MAKIKVWGPPGTGKTTQLINWVADHVAQGVAPEAVMFTTFTKAAAGEAAGRIRGKLEISGPFTYFSTEHSIAFRLLGLHRNQVFTDRKLQEFGKPYGYKFSVDTRESMESRYHEQMLKTLAEYYEFFVGYMQSTMQPFPDAYNHFLETNVEGLPADWSRRGLETYIDRRSRYKAENHLWDFDDFLYGVLEKHLIPPIKVMVLDEAQDCSPLLWEVAKLWMSGAQQVYVAGDPNQAIYSFAGCRPELFNDFPADEQVNLKLTHRHGLRIKDYTLEILRRAHLQVPDFLQAVDSDGIVGSDSFARVDGRQETFILARTRYLCKEIGLSLFTRGIPFTAERGERGPLGTNKASAYYAMLKVRAGEKVSTSELRHIVQFMKVSKNPFIRRGTKTHVNKLVEGEWGQAPMMEMGFHPDIFRAEPYDVLKMEIEPGEINYLAKVYKNYGAEPFEQGPKVIVTTGHGSKGREKEVVFVVPDMTIRVWAGFGHNPEPEHLLAYVEASRARSVLHICSPMDLKFYPFPKTNGRNN